MIYYILESLNNAGTENYIYQIVKNINCKNKLKLIVLSGENIDKNLQDSLLKYVGEILICNENNHLFWLYKALSNNKPQLIHCHLYSKLLPVIFLSKSLGIKSVATYHMPLSKWGLKIRSTWIASLLIVDKAIAVSKAVEEELIKYNKGVITCSPPISASVEKEKEKEKEKYELNILGVGRLSKEKDWSTLIKAIHLLIVKYKKDLHLTICGDGPNKESLIDLVKLLELQKNCSFVGHLDRCAVLKIISQADFFVLPSKFEGFGIAPVEAMQMGVPTITSNYPASNDYIINDNTGWHFEIGNYKQLANLIFDLIKNDKKRMNVAEQGQKFALEKFSPEKTANQHLQIYNHLLSLSS